MFGFNSIVLFSRLVHVVCCIGDIGSNLCSFSDSVVTAAIYAPLKAGHLSWFALLQILGLEGHAEAPPIPGFCP
jgi:hypothetical protein